MSAAAGAAVRVAAARVLRAVRFDGASLKAELPPAIAKFADARDRALCEAICFEACRWALRYEWMLKQLMPRALPASLREVHALLLVGLAQLDALQLADYAAISSTAEAARGLRHPRHVGLVNAVLRRFAREREALTHAAHDDAQAQHAHPIWLIERLTADWYDAAPAILHQNNRVAPMWLRVNAARTTPENYRERLATADIAAESIGFAPQALRLAQTLSPLRLPGWDAGEVSVQDVSAQLAAEAIDISAGQRVLDACAAPGGKAAHLLERTRGALDLLALDVDTRRLARVRDTLARLGFSARTDVVDAAAPGWWDGRAFDRILLDAPCSGTGVIRRQPDIKLHRRATDIPALVATQARLLDALWPMLGTGGRLVYATCSVLKDENERQIDAFLARTSNARARALPRHFGRPSGAGFQRLPGDDEGDGFFHAALEKTG